MRGLGKMGLFELVSGYGSVRTTLTCTAFSIKHIGNIQSTFDKLDNE